MRPFNYVPGGPAAAGPDFNGYTILLVDDDPSVSGLVEATLSAQGYQVLVARDSDQALRLSDSHEGEIDLLIADQVMPPFMSGQEVATCLRLLRPDLKVLYISGYGATDGVVDEVGDAFAAFLAKPFSPQELVAKVAALVSEDDREEDPEEVGAEADTETEDDG
jgi:two-component system, cell cycle sensor histidine kinase and response regulator CckA